MKITLSCLSNYLDHTASLDEIVDRLNSIGFEVDSTSPNSFLKGFVVVEVIEVCDHPNAKKLKVCKVYDGSAVTTVVCGDVNVSLGMKTVLAVVGSVLPNTSIKIMNSSIRGISSFGMLCSREELGLSNIHEQEGIIIVSDEYKIGESFFSDDTVMDINITINRGDCFGVYGIARELFASGIGKLKELRDVNIYDDDKLSDSPVDVDLSVTSSFFGRYIYDVQNKESPKWLIKILSSLGISPVSFIVDVCNYIMIFLNQPIFAYNMDSIDDNFFINTVRHDTKFTSYTGKDIIIPKGTVTISNSSNRVHAIAGIIQSYDTFCSSIKKMNIFLTASWFDSSDIISSSRLTNLVTESSCRYERGIDINLVRYALDLATEMIVNYCGGYLCKAISKRRDSYTENADQISFEYSCVNRLGNLLLDPSIMQSILNKLGFLIEDQESDFWKITVPSWRYDIKYSIDIVEEILRIYGYDNVKEDVTDSFNCAQNDDFIYDKLKSVLLVEGVDEVITWSFMSLQVAKNFGYVDGELVVIDNPINLNFNVMRPTLIPNLMQIVSDNISTNSKEGYSLFEMGNVYRIDNGKIINKFVVSALRYGKNNHRNIYNTNRSFDIFDLKSDFIKILKVMNVDYDDLKLTVSNNVYYHPVKSANLYMGNDLIGHFGEIHPNIVNYYNLNYVPICFEIILNDEFFLQKRNNSFCHYKYQAVKRDFAFVIADSFDVGVLTKMIKNLNPDFIYEVTVFDLYKGKDIGEGKSSVAFSVIFRSNKHTFSDAEIKVMSDHIINSVIKVTGGILR